MNNIFAIESITFQTFVLEIPRSTELNIKFTGRDVKSKEIVLN